jgi:hypothetical protein
MTMTANAVALQDALADADADPERIRDLADELAGETLALGRVLSDPAQGDGALSAIAAIAGADPDAAAATPLEAVASAGVRARHQHTAAARLLVELTQAFAERDGAASGDGPLLRLERWWDEDRDNGGPLISERGDLAMLAATADPQAARADLERDGYHDASDPSQPMAALWVRVGSLAPATA